MAEDMVPVLLTGVGGGGHGEQILKALRLGKLKYRVVGTDVSEISAGQPRSTSLRCCRQRSILSMLKRF